MRNSLSSHVCFALLMAQSAAYAEEQLQPPVEAEAPASSESKEQVASSALELPAFTVTARGVAETFLSTPMMVDVISSREIIERRLTTVEDALRTLPSVDIHEGGNVGNSFIWIRGTGSLTHTSLDDGSVDMRIDGVSNGLLGMSRNLLDVEQVEVAKGPQGTLFGQGAEAGVVTVKTWDPQPDFQGKVGFGVGSDNQRSVEGMLNLPLDNYWALRVAATRDETDDYIEKRENGHPLNRKTREAMQAKLRFNDGERNDMVLQVYEDSSDNFMPLVLNLEESTPRVTTGGLPHDSYRKNRGVIFNLKHDLDFAQFQSITSFHNHEGEVSRPARPLDLLGVTYDSMNIPAQLRPPLNAYFSEDRNNRQVQSDDIDRYSQEFRLVSPEGSEVGWVGGIYLSHQDRDFSFDSQRDLFVLGGVTLVGNDNYNALQKRNYKTDSKALYGEITYPLTQHLSLITGLRVVDERLRYKAAWIPNANNPLGVNGPRYDAQTVNDTYATGRVGLSLELSPQWTAYVMQSKGHKSGGFADYSTNVPNGETDTPYKASKISATEVGVKYASEGGRVQASMAVYQNTVDDDHITTSTYPTYLYDTKTVDSRSRGVELEGRWRATEQLTLRAAASHTDARVTSVPESARSVTDEGNRMPQVPYVSGSLGANYGNDLPFQLLGHARWFTDANLRYVGDRWAEPDNRQRLDSYTLLDASVGVSGGFGEVRLWGKNLTDEKWVYFGVQPGNLGVYAPGRSYGLAYTYEF